MLRPRREKGGGGGGTGWLAGAVSTRRGSAGVWLVLGWGAVASARVARSRPNFLQKWCKATVETRTPQVRLDEVENVEAAGVGMGQDELGDGAGKAR